MLLSHERGPVAAGGEGLNQDDTFVNLATFFRDASVPVPAVLCDARPEGSLLVEDMGDVALWHFAFDRPSAVGERIRQTLGPDATLVLYRRAADLIARIQACRPSPGCLAFTRHMAYEQYRAEAGRFVEHYLRPRGLDEASLSTVASALDRLCLAVAAHPRVLMHRDFMPWNIHVDPDGALGVLDFQDALLGSHAYDLVSLVHDRDADFALGDERCRAVVRHFRDRLDPGADFGLHCREALLQRYLRLAGQFHLLTARTGRPCYEGWVPGCLRRVGRTLPGTEGYGDLLDVLRRHVPEVARAAEEPWDLWT
jgi:hypothetical protein